MWSLGNQLQSEDLPNVKIRNMEDFGENANASHKAEGR